LHQVGTSLLIYMMHGHTYIKHRNVYDHPSFLPLFMNAASQWANLRQVTDP